MKAKNIISAFVVLLLLISSCHFEKYEKAGVPSDDATISDLIPDTIGMFAYETSLKLGSNIWGDYKILTATYGDNAQIQYTLIKTEYQKAAVALLKDSILQDMKNKFSNVRKKDGFLVAENDSLKQLAWFDENWVFIVKAKKDYYQTAVNNFNYVNAEF